MSGDTADSDGDGLATLLEYVFHRSPKQPYGQPLTLTKEIVEGVTIVHLSYPHNRFATDVTLSYEGTEDLQSWGPLADPSITATLTNLETE